LSEDPHILRKASDGHDSLLDSFLRHGADFTHFRHFQMDKITDCPSYYAEELICFMAYTKWKEFMNELYQNIINSGIRNMCSNW